MDGERAMPKQSKQRDSMPLNQLAAYSVDQFCALHNISRSKFYELVQLNKAPRCFWNGTSRRISAEAASDWRKQMEQEAAHG
jgi:excisionase family DNA binding protein